MQLKQQLNVSLTQKLSPHLIQSLKVYQSTYKGLVEQVREISEENVFLDVKEGDPYYSFKGGSSEDQSIDFVSKLPSLREHLLQQMRLEAWSEKHIQVGERLIDHLDSKGYLLNFPEIQEQIMQDMSVSKRYVSIILEKLQCLEPDGIAARNIKESLMIQLKARAFDDERLKTLLISMIKHHLDDIANENWSAIAKLQQLDTHHVQLLAQYIRDNLNPYPASAYQSDSVAEVFLTPSFEVILDADNQLKVLFLEQEKGISVDFNHAYYEEMLKKERDMQARAFIQNQYQKAKSFYEAFMKRRDTLKKVAFKIIHFQKAFFVKGEHFLKPLLQKDLALEFELSNASVSRLVKEKFIQYKGDIFPLRSLCVRDHFGRSRDQLKAHLKHLFELFPDVSDQKIANMAKNQGIKIARRTVTKYRHEIIEEAERSEKK